MRTKTLLLTAALSAAGVAASMAQVYSVNVVGYVNATIPANGWAILANPLNNGANALADVLKLPADGSADFTTIFRYDTAKQTFIASATFMAPDWTCSDPKGLAPLAPGEGFFIQNPNATPMTITFVGEVPQGNLSKAVPAGWSLLGSQVPQAARLGTMGFPVEDFDTVFVYDTGSQGYAPSYTYLAPSWDSAGDHDANGPMIPVAGGFWVQKGSAANWTRSFTVN